MAQREVAELQGILVHGSNHFIVNGPPPDPATARALLTEWELPMPLRPPNPNLARWSICTRAFRENLQWAVIAQSPEPHSTAVATLLEELRQRGVPLTAVP